VREVIIAHWPRGIVSERTYASSHEFKLSGLPWQCHVGDSVTSRRLVTRVLEALYNLGWIINVTAKVSHGLSDLDTLLFQYGTHSHRHPDLQGQIQYEWITVGFSTSDRLCLIDAPLDLIKTVMQTLGDSVESDLGYTYLGGYELKLNGTPWRATGEATMRTRQLALKVLEALRDHGWSVYASVDQKSTARYDILSLLFPVLANISLPICTMHLHTPETSQKRADLILQGVISNS
jgi:hypothetical protein